MWMMGEGRREARERQVRGQERGQERGSAAIARPRQQRRSRKMTPPAGSGMT
jgi:hypothetical protein